MFLLKTTSLLASSNIYKAYALNLKMCKDCISIDRDSRTGLNSSTDSIYYNSSNSIQRRI